MLIDDCRMINAELRMQNGEGLISYELQATVNSLKPEKMMNQAILYSCQSIYY